jgi:hypothetical protein
MEQKFVLGGKTNRGNNFNKEWKPKKVWTQEEIEAHEEQLKQNRLRNLSIQESIKRPLVQIICDAYNTKGYPGVKELLEGWNTTTMKEKVDEILESPKGLEKFLKFIFNSWLNNFGDTGSLYARRKTKQNFVKHSYHKVSKKDIETAEDIETIIDIFLARVKMGDIKF